MPCPAWTRFFLSADLSQDASTAEWLYGIGAVRCGLTKLGFYTYRCVGGGLNRARQLAHVGRRPDHTSAAVMDTGGGVPGIASP